MNHSSQSLSINHQITHFKRLKTTIREDYEDFNLAGAGQLWREATSSHSIYTIKYIFITTTINSNTSDDFHDNEGLLQAKTHKKLDNIYFWELGGLKVETELRFWNFIR
jgi:hypothetical protein